MGKTDFKAILQVSQTPEEIIKAINNIRGWWTTVFEGSSEKLNDIFTVRFGETFITAKIVELTPEKTIVWQVIDCYKHWLKDKKEWMDTKMCWEITTLRDGTQITFTHVGLVPGIECYGGCEKAWNFYLKESLFKFITDGKGTPETK